MTPIYTESTSLAQKAGKLFLAALICAGLALAPSRVSAWEVSLPPSNAPQMPGDLQGTEAASGEPFMNAIPVTGRDGTMNGEDIAVREMDGLNMGFAVPDGGGGIVWVPAPGSPPASGYMDAREMRLKIRELAEQLIAGMSVPGGVGSVALPTTFVNQDDFSQTSSLGRFVAEQLYHEFTQRGFPVREYRMASNLRVNGQGEFLLSRDAATLSAKTPNVFFVVGTYYVDRDALFMNARLVRGTDGMVLRTAQLVIPGANNVARRMLGGTGRELAAGTLTVRDFKTATQPTNLTPIDLGEDIH